MCVCSPIYPACIDYAPYYTVVCNKSGFTIYSKLSLREHIFRRGDLFNIKYVFWIPLQKFGAAFLVLRSIRRYITINAQTAYCKVTYYYKVLRNFNFHDRYSQVAKKNQISNFVKILPMLAVSKPFLKR